MFLNILQIVAPSAPQKCKVYSGVILNEADERPYFEHPNNPLNVLKELDAYALEKRKILEIGFIEGSYELETFKKGAYAHLKERIFKDEGDAVAKLKDAAELTYALIIARARAAELAKQDRALNCLNKLVLESLANVFLEPDAQKKERQKLVRAIPFIDVTNKFSATPLHYAVIGGHLPCVKLLLDRGANVEVCAHEDKTLIAHAPKHNRVLATQCAGRPLHVAAQGGHRDIAALLLERGAGSNALDGAQRTALHAAAIGGHEAIARLLLDAGTDAKRIDKESKTAEHYAHIKGYYALAAYLLKRADGTNRVNDLSLTPLHYAAMANDCEEASRLEREGLASLNHIDKNSFMPIHYAAQMGNERMLGWCLDRAPFIPSDAASILCVAARAGQMRAAELLIDRGGDILCGTGALSAAKPLAIFDEQAVPKKSRQLSYMLWALEERLPDFIDLLIKRGVKETPEITLTRALWRRLSTKKEILSERNILRTYPLIEDEWGTPLHHAVMAGHEDLFSTLLQSAIAFEIIHECNIKLEEEEATYKRRMVGKIIKKNEYISVTNEDRRKRGFREEPYLEVPAFVWSAVMSELDPASLDDERIWNMIVSACAAEVEKQKEVMATDIITIVGKTMKEKILPLFGEVFSKTGVYMGRWQNKVLSVVIQKAGGAFLRCLNAPGKKDAYAHKTPAECAFFKVQENKDLEAKERDLRLKARAEAQKENNEAAHDRGRNDWDKAFARETKAYELEQEAHEHKRKAKSFKKLARKYQKLANSLTLDPEILLRNILEDWFEIVKD